MLVEDNPLDIDLTRRALARRHVTNPLLVARDGEEALALLPRLESGELATPVCVLLDLKLPRVDGLEVLRHLKQNDRLGTIPVIILTTSAEDQDVQTAYRLGANSYIVKPVDFEKFLEVAAQIQLYWTVLNNPPR
jgi:CheY-like chemotaxis protein